MKDKPRYVSVDSVEAYKKAAEQAQKQFEADRAAQHKEFEKERAELKRLTPPPSATTTNSTPAATPSPFMSRLFITTTASPTSRPLRRRHRRSTELKDGKPSLIQYDFDAKTNRYIIPKILDQGYLRVGKSELRFAREVS